MFNERKRERKRETETERANERARKLITNRAVFRETANPVVYFPCVHSWNNNPPWFRPMPGYRPLSPSFRPLRATLSAATRWCHLRRSGRGFREHLGVFIRNFRAQADYSSSSRKGELTRLTFRGIVRYEGKIYIVSRVMCRENSALGMAKGKVTFSLFPFISDN